MTGPTVSEPNLPLELTAPLIQRLARKGLSGPLDEAERTRLCACVLHHVDAILAGRRIPKVEAAPPALSGRG